MPLNPEIAEMTPPRAEQPEQNVSARIASQSWNQNDIRALNANRLNSSACDEFGNLELTDDQNPIMIAKVDATLDRRTGIMTVTELDGNSHHKKGEKMSIHMWSGNGKYGIGYEGGEGADGKYDNVQDKGPLPKGEYLIGNGYESKEITDEHPGGDSHWYRLYGDDGKGGYSYDQMANGRGGFNFHVGLHSNGCGTIPSEVGEDSTTYPTSKQYNKLKDFLDNTSPYIYNPEKPDDTYRGKLHVK